jgi:hypothetical protein
MPEALTYAILEAGHAIQCLLCNSISHHPADVAERYCGNCHRFHTNPATLEAAVFVCAGCGGRFLRARPENEVLEEFRRNFPTSSPGDVATVCEECYQKHMARFN